MDFGLLLHKLYCKTFNTSFAKIQTHTHKKFEFPGNHPKVDLL